MKKTGFCKSACYRFLAKDNHFRWLEVQSSTVYNNRNEPQHVMTLLYLVRQVKFLLLCCYIYQNVTGINILSVKTEGVKQMLHLVAVFQMSNSFIFQRRSREKTHLQDRGTKRVFRNRVPVIRFQL